MNNNNKNNTIYISQEITKAFGITASWVFSTIAYHIEKHGSFNPKKTWSASTKLRTGVGKNSQKRAIRAFIEQGVLLEVDGSYIKNPDSATYDAVFLAYAHISKKRQNEKRTVSLIEVIPQECDQEKMKGSSSKQQRAIVTLSSWLRYLLAGEKVHTKKSTLKLPSYAYIAYLFGFDWRTVKAALSALKKVSIEIGQKTRHRLKVTLNDFKDALYLLKIGRMKQQRKDQFANGSKSKKPTDDDGSSAALDWLKSYA